SNESAIISWDGEEQRIIMSLDVDSPTSDAALLIPTPAPATVEIAQDSAFAELAEFTSPRVREVDLWWPEWLVREDLDNDGVSIASGPPPPPVPIGGAEVDVIDASDAGRLESWLSKNDYVMRDDVAEALVPYIQQGWHFLLVKLDAESLSGRL